MSSKQNKFARLGVATKGWVYLIIGGLTAFAAFGLGGEKAGSSDALSFIAAQTFGKILLSITAVGLLGYLFFRWYQAFKGSVKSDHKGVNFVTRVGFFGSGITYGLLAFSAINYVWDSSNQGNGSSGLSKIFNSEYGMLVGIVMGTLFIIKAGSEFYRVFSKKFKEQVAQSKLSTIVHDRLIQLGTVGFAARGVVFSVLSFLFIKAAFNKRGEDMGKQDAFSFIQNTFGSTILGVIALGLIAYGIFMIVSAKYSDLEVG